MGRQYLKPYCAYSWFSSYNHISKPIILLSVLGDYCTRRWLRGIYNTRVLYLCLLQGPIPSAINPVVHDMRYFKWLLQCIESNIYDTIHTICAMCMWKLNHTLALLSYVASCNKGVLHSVWPSTLPHSQAMWEERKWSGINCLRMHDHSYFCKIVSFTLSVYMDQLAGHIGTDLLTIYQHTWISSLFWEWVQMRKQWIPGRSLSSHATWEWGYFNLSRSITWLQYTWPISVRAIVTVR